MGQAARLFNGAAEQTLYRRIAPSEEQRAFLQEQWNRLADYLRPTLAAWGFPVTTWLQGSYKYGTLIRPVRLGESFDVDVGVYFSWDSAAPEARPAVGQLRDWVQSALSQFQHVTPAVKEVVDPAKERCSRAIYVQNFHIDTPVYHLDSVTDARRLACLSGQWEASDPKILYKWFRDIVALPQRDQLRRLIRYLKGWAAVAFVDAPESRPSSILLTVCASVAYRRMMDAGLTFADDDDALIALILKVYLSLREERRVENPVDHREDLNRIPDLAWQAFLVRLALLNDAAQSAAGAETEVDAALAWEGAFSFLMPFPEADEVEVVEPNTDLALMQVPDIDVEVYERKGGRLLARHRNEVPAVAQDRWLVFTIANRELLPNFADIAWTVRNAGDDADRLGDLGHTQRGIDLRSVEEHTSYLGKHFMDCVVRLNGSVFAMRRVPVLIASEPQKLIGQSARSWMRLRTRRGRR
ncbi:CBASS cGAMP synthase [Achromobacter aloeverae]